MLGFSKKERAERKEEREIYHTAYRKAKLDALPQRARAAANRDMKRKPGNILAGLGSGLAGVSKSIEASGMPTYSVMGSDPWKAPKKSKKKSKKGDLSIW